MTQRAVHFEQIDVHRVMGIARGKGYSLTELSAGIILIHGPNGSGKSTTARVIQELLWPGRTELERPSIGGRFCDGQDTWQLEIDAGHHEILCNDQVTTVPEYGPPENRRRYYLPLHELIQDENADFAKVIADKSQGGFDLDAAAKSLDFRERGRSRSNERQSLQNCQAEVDASRHNQKDIENAFSQLQQLRSQHVKALEAGSEIEIFKLAREHHEAASRCHDLQVQLTAVPEGVARLRGDERQRLDEIAARTEELKKQQLAEHTRSAEAEKTLREVALGESGVEPEVLRHLKGWQQRLKDIESDIRGDRQRLAEAKSSVELAKQRLSQHIGPEQLNAINTIEVGELSVFARKAHRLLGQRHALEEQEKQLSADDSPKEQTLDSHQLRDGITSLSRWLASPEPATATTGGKRYLPMLVIAIAMVAMTAFLAVTYHWAWSFAILLALGVVAAGWWIGRENADRQVSNSRQVHQQSYIALGIDSPQLWDESSVRQHFDKLVRLVVLQAQQEDRGARLKDLRSSFKTFNQEANDLKEEREKLERQLGLEINFLSDEWLPLLVDNISKWQRSSDQLVGIQKSVGVLDDQRSKLIEKINDSLSAFAYSEIDSADTAAEAISELEDRATRHREAVEKHRDAKQRIEDTIVPGLEALASQQTELFESLEITTDQQLVIDEWLALRPHYLDHKNKLSQEEAIRADREKALTGREELLVLELPAIEQRLEELQSVADNRDTLTSEIAGIEQQVEKAKEGFELSAALEAQNAAVAVLEDARDDNCRSVIGAVLTEIVREEAIDRSRPDVFRRANELLVKFTRGTLQLELDDQQSSPSFQARSATGRSRPLNQLSSGERIQLLIAVRIAFLEHDERSRLPLLLDEALGTTDDERIAVIIDSVIELANEGRQVFYFTAQQDEVGKWIARMKQAGVSYKVIDLGKTRQLAASASRPLEIAAVESVTLPTLNGLSYGEYGKALSVPGLDPLEESVDSIHLWHVLDDAETLHKLLEKQIANWGQLQLLIDHGGAGLVDLADGKLESAVATARAIEAACSAWREGHGKAVDRIALLDSDCVSDSFIDEVSELADSTEGDARAIIDALQDGQVKRWRANNTEGLSEYFESHGYLAARTPLSLSELRVRVMAAVASELNSSQITDSLIDRIVGSLPS